MQADTDGIFKGRINELAKAAAGSGRFMFTDFLNMAQQSYILTNQKNLPAQVDFFGGYTGAERVIAAFFSPDDSGCEIPFPVEIIRISPLKPGASCTLLHRDFLGAVLNLGIDRKLTGDILTDGTQGWIFVREHIAPFIEESLSRVKNTAVCAQKVQSIPEGIIRAPEAVTLIVPSLRLDVLVSKALNLQRKDAEKLINSEKVFINSIILTKTSHTVKPGDLVSVRGHGRFRFSKTSGTTKKGNLKIIVEKY